MAKWSRGKTRGLLALDVLEEDACRLRQQLAGVVLNAHVNFPRAEYDRLKAILYNCRCHGPESQNRDAHPDFRAHLAGRVAYVAMINPDRGRRLRALFEQIRWEPGG